MTDMFALWWRYKWKHNKYHFDINIQQMSKHAQETRVTKKLYIVFKYSKLLNKYKMCSHDLHIGQYMHCPFLILFTCFPLPTQHAKMSANYSHLFCFFFAFFLCFFFCCFFKSIGNLDSCLLDKDHTDGTPGTVYSVGWRRPTKGKDRLSQVQNGD